MPESPWTTAPLTRSQKTRLTRLSRSNWVVRHGAQQAADDAAYRMRRLEMASSPGTLTDRVLAGLLDDGMTAVLAYCRAVVRSIVVDTVAAGLGYADPRPLPKSELDVDTLLRACGARYLGADEGLREVLAFAHSWAVLAPWMLRRPVVELVSENGVDHLLRRVHQDIDGFICEVFERAGYSPLTSPFWVAVDDEACNERPCNAVLGGVAS